MEILKAENLVKYYGKGESLVKAAEKHLRWRQRSRRWKRLMR